MDSVPEIWIARAYMIALPMKEISQPSNALRLLRSLVDRSPLGKSGLAKSLDLEEGEIDDLLEGRKDLGLERLEALLSALGMSPPDFFARLYSPGRGAVPAAETATGANLGRDEVEGLIEEVKAKLRRPLLPKA